VSDDYFISMWIKVTGNCEGLVDLVGVLSRRVIIRLGSRI